MAGMPTEGREGEAESGWGWAAKPGRKEGREGAGGGRKAPVGLAGRQPWVSSLRFLSFLFKLVHSLTSSHRLSITPPSVGKRNPLLNN